MAKAVLISIRPEWVQKIGGGFRMSDYISREAAIEKIREACCTDCGGSSAAICRFCDFENAVRLIKSLPAADVEPVRHGRWEGYTHSRYCGMDEYGDPIYRDGTVYYCFNPKCRRKTVVKEKFCPSCGTKMNLEEDSFEV